MLSKLKYFTISFVIFTLGCSTNFEWVDSLPKPWLLNEEEVSELLPKFKEQYPDFGERLKALTLWRIGTPYEEFKLGEEKLPDTDPLFRLDVSDCTVHVLTSLVMAQSSNWDEARGKIINLHYKENADGIHLPTYTSRWHFTSDRLLSNPSTVNITERIVSNDELKSVELVLNQKHDGSYLLDIDWTKSIQISYIPNYLIDNDFLIELPDICGIAFVRESYIENGLLIAHEGILLDKIDLVHASSNAGQTVKIDFMEYYFSNDYPIFDGILIYKFVPLD